VSVSAFVWRRGSLGINQSAAATGCRPLRDGPAAFLTGAAWQTILQQIVW